MTTTFTVALYHAAMVEIDQAEYWSTAIDAAFDEGDHSHTMLMLSNMVQGLQAMYAGDRIRLFVGNPEIGTWGFAHNGIVEREDATLRLIARELEGRA